MLLLCCNLLSLPDGGSTTEWPGGFHLHHLPSFVRHHASNIRHRIRHCDVSRRKPRRNPRRSGTTAGPEAFSFRLARSSQADLLSTSASTPCAALCHRTLRFGVFCLTSSSLAQYARPRRRGLAVSATSLTLVSLSRIQIALNCSASPRLPRCLSSRCRLLFVPVRTRRTS